MRTPLRRWTPGWVVSAILLSLLLLPAPAAALILDDDSRFDVTLGDGTTVILYAAAAPEGRKSKQLYYLPVNLRLAQRAGGTPEFLFLKFATEQREDQGGVSGGLFHFLMEWGLTPAQEEELRAELSKLDRGLQLMGAAPLRPEADTGTFQIVSGTLTDEGMTRSLVSSGKAPLLPGGKVAAAARLSDQGAQLLAATLDKTRSIADVSIALNLAYETLMPAAKGSITFDWERLEEESAKLVQKYGEKKAGKAKEEVCLFIYCVSRSKPRYTSSYEEIREQYKFLEEQEIVKVEFDEMVSDERVQKIREAFFQYFLNSMAEPAEAPELPELAQLGGKPKRGRGSAYTLIENEFRREAHKSKTMSLDYRLAVRWPLQVVGNLASWYDGVRDNPKCVATVMLNDPFFEHRDIRFVLDLDATEMFDEAINYVTVNVRKNRDQGRSFEDRVTLDAEYIRENGITAAVTYARGEDTNPDAYEYQVRWGVRGGHQYPAEPSWQPGSWEGVTLSPPIVPRVIEVEADLDELRSRNIARITVQVHYPMLGQEREANIHLSPTKGEPLVERRIFLDRNARGYVYRLVVHHKTEGRFALPWSPQVGDDYIYASVPDELESEPSFREAAKRAAEALSTSQSEKVLDLLELLKKAAS